MRQPSIMIVNNVPFVNWNGVWYFEASRRFIEDFGERVISFKFIQVWYDFDRATRIYAHWTIAPFLIYWFRYRSRRYILEHYLVRKGIFICKEGKHLKHWRFNWDWRWYNPPKSGRRYG